MKLATLLASNARRHPDKVALVCGESRLTFAELNARGDRLANALAGRGVGCGDRVAIAMPNGIEPVEAMAAVLKLGALIVPLSTRLTAREIAHILGDCEPRAVLYSEGMRAAAAAALDGLSGAARIVVGAPEAGEEGYAAFLESGAPAPPPGPPAAEDDCMIVYTSGTHGAAQGRGRYQREHRRRGPRQHGRVGADRARRGAGDDGDGASDRDQPARQHAGHRLPPGDAAALRRGGRARPDRAREGDRRGGRADGLSDDDAGVRETARGGVLAAP